jgi:membrane-associated phospholipid phosphatase
MHIAMHDAINAIHRHYGAYVLREERIHADPTIAAVQAAYEVAVSQYPRHTEQWNRRLARSLQTTSDDSMRLRSVELGLAAATAILTAREHDHWNAESNYEFQTAAPGVYVAFPEHSGTPAGFVFGVGWPKAKPFTLNRADQLRVGPPPAISSAQYAAAFAEVKALGSFESRSRSKDQTHLAFWWKDFAENSHNRLARQLVEEQRTDLWTATRLFALLNMAIMDANIASFDSKFAYNHWRPYTAIHAADHDGNPRTSADVNWTNTHRHTYPFPSYPSAHGTTCATAMTVLADTFGDAHAFKMITREVSEGGPASPKMRMQPASRSFESFSAAAMECAVSRVYLGIHFRYDSLAGSELGRAIGTHAVNHWLMLVP